MNLSIEQICIPGELHVCASVDAFLWPQTLSLSMAFRGTELAESAYSPWLIRACLPFAHPLMAPRFRSRKQRSAKRCRLSVRDSVGTASGRASQEETLLGSERTEAGSNPGSSPLTFYAGSSRVGAAFPQGASALWPGPWASGSHGPWTQNTPSSRFLQPGRGGTLPPSSDF